MPGRPATGGVSKGRAMSTMTIRPRLRHTRRALLALAAATTLAVAGLLAGGGTPSRAATQEPCDIYASAGTPCVAAHSTTRALYAAYNGSLYQVRRASDGKTLNIRTLRPGGYASAAAQMRSALARAASSPRSMTSPLSITTSP